MHANGESSAIISRPYIAEFPDRRGTRVNITVAGARRGGCKQSSRTENCMYLIV